MSVLFLVLALATADPAAAGPTAPPVEAAQPPYPAGAPRDDYGLVSWCYGALRGYLDLHDQAMPEVKRIESTWRRPGSNLADDLAVYGQMQREGEKSLKLFARAMEAAEKASLKPINTQGAAALQKGRATWAAAGDMPKARLAQEWMSWSLPARCEPTASSLEQRARLLGTAFQVNSEPDPLSGTETPLATPATP
ncbi:hypothetical protein [Phenylobacterium sp.]|jgi:hypothetical protein|uniref:hypothetical protein n=1 Tax=Phenylobacterium sp. TaxID=1871053 RepID=UPI002F4046B0